MPSRDVTEYDRAAATRIRVLAAMRNMKQADVADAAGFPRATFERYWNAKRSMTLGDFDLVLKTLGTSYAEEADEIRALLEGE